MIEKCYTPTLSTCTHRNFSSFPVKVAWLEQAVFARWAQSHHPPSLCSHWMLWLHLTRLSSLTSFHQSARKTRDRTRRRHSLEGVCVCARISIIIIIMIISIVPAKKDIIVGISGYRYSKCLFMGLDGGWTFSCDIVRVPVRGWGGSR